MRDRARESLLLENRRRYTYLREERSIKEKRNTQIGGRGRNGGGRIREEDNGKSRKRRGTTKIKVSTIGRLFPSPLPTPGYSKSSYPPALIHSGECFMEIASAADASALYAPGRSGLNLHRDFISRGSGPYLTL